MHANTTTSYLKNAANPIPRLVEVLGHFEFCAVIDNPQPWLIAKTSHVIEDPRTPGAKLCHKGTQDKKGRILCHIMLSGPTLNSAWRRPVFDMTDLFVFNQAGKILF